MKICHLIILLHLFCQSCDGQNKNISYSKEKIMNTETFDIISYEKIKTEQLKKEFVNPWTVETISSSGEII